MDLVGDGRLDCVVLERPAAGFYERSAPQGSQPFTPLEPPPNVDWNDPNRRMIDVDGDGFSDVLNNRPGFGTFNSARNFESADSILIFVASSAMLQLLYPVSLLYAISLEDDNDPVAPGDEPIVRIQCYAGPRYNSIPSVVEQLKVLSEQVIGTVASSKAGAGPPGTQSTASTHGRYPLDETTIESTIYRLRHGPSAPSPAP